MLRYRTQGLLAVGLGMVAGGCFGEPVNKTDLRSEGPPEVLAAMGQSLVTLEEYSFHCRYVNGVRDEKAPGFAIDAILGGQIVCPETATEFAPTPVDPRAFALRVMFDELLDADAVETLDCDDDGRCSGSLDSTQPVTLTCDGTVVGYTGYYVPNGNNTTFPLGPSLYIAPNLDELVFPTGTECTLSIGDVVVDKTGNAVPADQRDLDLQIADLALLFTEPADADAVGDRAVLGPDEAIAFVFNTYLDDATIAATEVVVLDGDGDPVADVDFAVDAYFVDTDTIYVFSTATDGFPPGNYTARITASAEIGEVNGGTVTFTANEDVRFVVE